MISSQPMRGLLAACAFLCALTPAALAQQGQLVGVVIDAEFGDPLPGANIIVEGTATGTATDFEGRYTLSLAPGTYDVVYSFIGYQDQTVRGIEITAGQDTEINVNLGTDAVQMDGEVVVEAEALRNSEGILLRDRKKAAAVSDAISAEAISRSGSSTASDAMQKVTGASVVGGKYVYVRGLGDRYINTQLNGADLPSADPDRNAVPLDLFPSGLLDNIVTSKTFTPDKPGSFTGGTVDIATKSFPDAFTLSISSSATYNTSASLQSDFIQHSDGPINLLGSVDLDVPESLSDPSVEIPRLSDARRDVETAGQLNDLSQAFSTPFAPGFGSTPVNQSYGFSLGNRFDLGGRPLGVVGSLSYSRNFSGYAGTNYARFRLSGAEATTLSPIYSLEDQSSTEEVLAGGLVNVTYRFLPQHQVGVNYMYNQSAEAEARFLEGFVDQVGE
ncbi:MAG: carboxypeptidase-like regulatory domain-containing protein, partial [Bacteroidota bacterium]